MKRPWALIAFLFAAGILWGKWSDVSLSVLFVFCFLLWGLCAIEKTPRLPLLELLLFSCGWLDWACSSALLSPWDLRRLETKTEELATLRGRLTGPLVYRFREDKETWRSVAQLRASAWKRRGEWEPAFGLVLVQTRGIVPGSFSSENEVEVEGVLRIPAGPMVEELFDFRAFLESQGIYFTLEAESPEDWSAVSAGERRGPNWSDRFVSWAQAALARGLPVEDEPLRLLWAMVLGWKTALTGEVSEPFMRTGTLHIFAISGLHVALIAGILLEVLRLFLVPRAVCGWLIVPLLWLYTAATGWQSSAIRSTVMMSVVIGSWSFHRPSDVLNSLAASAFLILAWQPGQLFQAGFQLSFGVVFALALAAARVHGWLQRIILPDDPLLPTDLRPAWRRWLDDPVNHLRSNLSVSIAAWFGALPLVAHYFYLVTPVSLLANLIVVPASSLALMSSLGSLICARWLPSISELFNHSAWFWMAFLTRFSRAAAEWHWGYFYVRPPGWFGAGIYFLVFAAVFGEWAVNRFRRILLGVVCGALVAFLVIERFRERAGVEMTLLPFKGDALFVKAAASEAPFLVDCGNSSDAQALGSFLHAQGLGEVRSLVLTHGDLNHVGGAEILREKFHPTRVFTGPMRFRSPAYRRFLDGLEPQGGWKKISRGDAVAGWRVLHPEAQDRFPRADDGALVFFAEINRSRVLLLSDLGELGQRALLARTPDLRADIVVTGIPLKEEPLYPELLRKVRPKLIVVTGGEMRLLNRAGARLRRRLARSGAKVIYLAESGTARLRFTKAGWQLWTSDGTAGSREPDDKSVP